MVRMLARAGQARTTLTRAAAHRVVEPSTVDSGDMPSMRPSPYSFLADSRLVDSVRLGPLLSRQLDRARPVGGQRPAPPARVAPAACSRWLRLHGAAASACAGRAAA